MGELAVESLDTTYEEVLLDEIMNKYGQLIWRLVYSYVRNQAIADDLTQEVYVKCYKSLHTFRHQSKLKTWVWTIAANHCKDYLKSAYHRKVLITDQLPAFSQIATNDVEDIVVAKEMGEKLDAAVRKLPEIYQDIIMLHFYEERSLKEIEAITELNMNTIKTRIRRGKDMLKQELASSLV
ncbi:sigma-70 family RNA polymerase sigma factor [Salinibacillus xinjiangensis]|uniref:Sigma-70 family RNA polymerase sigma factor n=1 Tax=Salinibacillus xinjiangensis TaxID=1229268 RepID=A0A6G1X9V9_9BACI|nr:sigma-70 family RNA polymerase sigma factor [Salinibacillus xinjiangensis]MRG87764.1 sigma-70 family RNA polymerase sigma factor [Salinibacillus xinjiangensis]